MTRSSLAKLMLFLVLNLLAGSLHAEVVALRDGLLVDTERGIAYTMRPKGGIAALAADSGTEVWRSLQADQPLAIDDGVVVAMADQALAGQIDLRTLDLDTGSLLRTAPHGVAPRVQAQVGNSLTHRFRIVAASPQDARTIAWRYEYRPPRGMPEVPGEPTLRREDVGALSLAPATGQVSRLPSPPAGIFTSSPPALPTAVGPALKGRQFVSEDGKHVLVVSRSDASDFRRYEWTLVDASGSVVLNMRHFISYSPFVVADGRLLVTEPPHAYLNEQGDIVEHDLRLVAYDLAGGSQAWATAIRDTEYRGPFPW